MNAHSRWTVLIVAAAVVAACLPLRASEPGRLKAACGLLTQGDAKGAIGVLDEVLRLDPRYADAYLHRALARDILGDRAGASSDFAESLKSAPGEAPVPAVDRLCDPSLSSRTRKLQENRELGRAAKDKGIALFLAGKRKEALKLFDKAVSRDPGDPGTYQSRAVVREVSGNAKGAIEDYAKACRLSESDSDSLAGMLVTLSALRERAADPQGAAADLERAVKVAPAAWPGRESAGLRLKALRDAVEAGGRASRPPSGEALAGRDALSASAAQPPPAPAAPEQPKTPSPPQAVPIPPPAAAPAPPSNLSQEGTAPSRPDGRDGTTAPVKAETRQDSVEEQDSMGEAEMKRSVALLSSYQEALTLLRKGRAREAIAMFKALAERTDKEYFEYPALRYEIISLLGIAHLRAGDRSVCQRLKRDPSCLFPRNLQDLRVEPKDAEAAIRYFEQVLSWKPADLQVQWLLNLAYIGAGRHPGGAPKKWLIPPEAFGSTTNFKRFTDAAPRLGLDFPSHAGGSIMEDFDGDGLLDIMASSCDLGESLRYFHNKGDGGFAEWTKKAGLEGVTGAMHISQADYDNDGRTDVMARVENYEEGRGSDTRGLVLLRNKGDGTFEDATAKAGLSGVFPGWAVVWGDYNNDGWLDFYIGNDDIPKFPTALYRADGKGGFVNATQEARVAVSSTVRGANWGDYDNDGRLDLYVSVQNADNVLYRNMGPDREGKWRFEDATARAGVAKPWVAFVPWFWDYDNDGWDDLLVMDFPGRSATELAAADHLGVDYDASHPVLYRNRGDGAFEDVSRAAGITRSIPAMGANFGDFDGDGWLDFYTGTGDPDVRDFVPNLAFRNVDGKTFEDVTVAGGFGLLHKGHGISFGDVDGDGDQDVFAEMGGHYWGDWGRNALFMNPGFGNRWVTLSLEGTRSNRSAIGARIKVVADTPRGPRSIHRTVTTGGSFGANPLRQNIGLGLATAIRSIEIRWPAGGEVQRFENPPLDGFLSVKEGTQGFRVAPKKAVPIRTD
ncbi:MAG: VCBS repeat-containing protein [Elusimicrobia bacterium]|nr:VCBS repeat-containing protein [Elusimicrobiota bacterium]